MMFLDAFLMVSGNALNLDIIVLKTLKILVILSLEGLSPLQLAYL